MLPSLISLLQIFHLLITSVSNHNTTSNTTIKSTSPKRKPTSPTIQPTSFSNNQRSSFATRYQTNTTFTPTKTKVTDFTNNSFNLSTEASNTTTSNNDVNDKSVSQTDVILLCHLAVALIIIFYLAVRLQKLKATVKVLKDLEAQENIVLSENLKETDLYTSIADFNQTFYDNVDSNDDDIVVPILDVYDLRYVGSGHFGIVFKGYCDILNSKFFHKMETVVIKIPKDFVKSFRKSEQWNNAFTAEIDLHYRIPKHENVLTCCGLTSSNGTLGIVLEYVTGGTLKLSLQKLFHLGSIRKTMKKSYSFLGHANLNCIEMSKGIIDGMVHLEKYKIIHRALAAHNILINGKNVCKISDFGLAYAVSQMDENTDTQKNLIPVRWLPPEVLLHDDYSGKSDVWSFGIVLWEIITLGGTPYYDIKSGSEVREAVVAGYRMPALEHCTLELYEIMRMCWDPLPSNRPTFEKLQEIFKTFIPHRKQYVDMRKFDISIHQSISSQIYYEKAN